MDSIAHVSRRDVIVVVHVRLEVPPDPQVDRQSGRRSPVILQIGANLRVIRVHDRIAVRPDHLKRASEVIRLGPRASRRATRVRGKHIAQEEELRNQVVRLANVVRQEGRAHPALEYVNATAGCVSDVVTQRHPLLSEILHAQVAA